MKKRKKVKKKLIILLITIVLIIALLCIVFYKLHKNKFIGTWITEGGTIYEFKNAKTGTMKTALSSYNFTYTIKNDTILIDFEDKKLTDTNYKFSFKKNKCTMTSNRGNFIFTKK